MFYQNQILRDFTYQALFSIFDGFDFDGFCRWHNFYLLPSVFYVSTNIEKDIHGLNISRNTTMEIFGSFGRNQNSRHFADFSEFRGLVPQN